jgi:hypothetical protein
MAWRRPGTRTKNAAGVGANSSGTSSRSRSVRAARPGLSIESSTSSGSLSEQTLPTRLSIRKRPDPRSVARSAKATSATAASSASTIGQTDSLTNSKSETRAGSKSAIPRARPGQIIVIAGEPRQTG